MIIDTVQVNDEYIEELFAVKLGNMEATPPEDGWIRIENELYRRVQMRRKIWTVAASFALVLSVTASIIYTQSVNIKTDNNTTIAIVENSLPQPEELPLNIEEQPDMIEYQMSIIEKQPAVIEEQPPTIDVAYDTYNNVAEIEDTPQNNISGHFALSDEIPAIEPIITEPVVTEPIVTEPVVENIARNAPEIIPEKKSEELIVIAKPLSGMLDYPIKLHSRKRWDVTVQFAPMQSYRTISSVPSGLRKSDFDEAESPLRAYSAGIAMSYRVFNRLSIQTGVFYSQMGQSINNVSPATNMYAAISSNNSYPKNFVKTSSGSISVASNLKSDVNTTYSSYFNDEMQSENNIAVSNSNTNISNFVKYRLIEKVNYLEIPLMLRYTIIDKKLQYYIFGGVSANVLLGTDVFVDNGEELVRSGSILMARSVNYSNTIGLGIGYQIFNNLSIGLEPSFKYFRHSYTTSSQIDSNPYAFGISTGFTYRF